MKKEYTNRKCKRCNTTFDTRDCPECKRRYARQWRQDHPEEHNEYQKNYKKNKKENPEL